MLVVEALCLGLVCDQAFSVYQTLDHLHVLTADPGTLGPFRYGVAMDDFVRSIETRRKSSLRRPLQPLPLLHIFRGKVIKLSLRMRTRLLVFAIGGGVSSAEVGVDERLDVGLVPVVVGGVLEVDELVGAVKGRVVG